ncbi:ABC transporter substrate-binding protein [Sulfitobacter porphyrae]|uniref:ABC transporter substrate-binding protein n=1 Tax=Sulfitobacter porphyrae TaxID=1246864 RepID=A0ABW2B3Q7_9RHOB
MRISEMLRGLLLAGALMASAGALAGAPSRVVSMNLCTDQLAMLVAGDGQLHSVSYLASDPRGSAMAEQAAAYVTNHGLAEEIYLMQPDLVIAGSFSTRATVDMLTRLGIPVVRFDPAYALEDVRARLLQMGEVLGRQDRAADLVAAFDARLAAYQAEVTTRPRAALYYANGYTSGDKTLAGQILVTAGLANIAAEEGFSAGGHPAGGAGDGCTRHCDHQPPLSRRVPVGRDQGASGDRRAAPLATGGLDDRQRLGLRDTLCAARD